MTGGLTGGLTGAASVVVAAACGLLTVLLAGAARPSSPIPHRRPWRASAVPVVALLAVLAALVGPGRRLVLLLIAAAVAVVALRLLRDRRADRRAERNAARVLESCDQVAAELGAGQAPGAALARAATDWPLLSPVAEAHRVGADVPAAWRSVAAAPGAADLRVVAAAWEVAHRTGHGLATALDRVADDLRADRATRRVVAGELASARATARLVAVLPLAALAMGSGVGGDPWSFLLGSVPGLACLAAGLACGLAGLAWIEAIARAVTGR